jgi:SAM-dependent methyltransferase
MASRDTANTGSSFEFGAPGQDPADGRLDAAAFLRNHAAIASVLADLLEGHTGDVLEVGSGTGQHAIEFARQMPTVTWWPTDPVEKHLRSIEAWRKSAKLDNVKAPIRLDAAAADWQFERQGLPSHFTVIFCANVIHIAPWAVAEGLFAGASRHLRAGGQLMLYGPFKRDGEHNAPSNAAFDQRLRRENPEWGVRDSADLRELALRNNLNVLHTFELPANNAILTFQKSWW